MEPFYTLSDGSSSSSSSMDGTRLTSPSPSPTTHDTSRASFHLRDIASFAENLQNAADRAFPNRGRSRYQTVNVCLIRWAEDDLEVKDELDTLHDVFETLYGFNTEVWLIPSVASQIQLTSMTCNFLQKFDAEGNLFIVYYGGHGTINKSRQNQWWCNPTPDSPYVDWSAIQTLFGSAMSDVLVLLDCCAAASSSPGFGPGVMEAIAACGFETKAPPPGEYSFTNTLIEVLAEWANKPCFSAAMLHTEVLFVLKQKRPERGRDGRKYEWCSTPIHLVYTGNPKSPGIEICSLRKNTAVEKAAAASELSSERSTTYVDAMDLDDVKLENPLTACDPYGDFQVPHVLISIALDENQACLDAASCRRWLADFPALAKYATVEGIYKSYSTLITLSMPVMIWDLLSENPACSFIGYVTSPNMYHDATATGKTSVLASQAGDSKVVSMGQRDSKLLRRRRSVSGDSSYESGTEEPDHHKLLAISAKTACLAMAEPTVPTKPISVEPSQHSRLFETDEESDASELDSDDTSDWEDVIPPASSPKADEKPLFQRVDSKRDLASSKSLLTAMLSGSVPAAPVEIGGSRKQAGKARDQKALSPRSTRRKMLATELSVSLRQHLLWERQQKRSAMPSSQYGTRGGEGMGVALRKERSNSF